MREIKDRMNPGEYLWQLRRRAGLTTRKVAELSHSIALEHRMEEYSISHARLIQIENEGSLPSVYKLFSLSLIYGVSLADLIAAYLGSDDLLSTKLTVRLPQTCTLSLDDGQIESDNMMHDKAIETVDTRPLHASEKETLVSAPIAKFLGKSKCRYAVIGDSDFTMHPLIPAGSLVQVDTSQRAIKTLRVRAEQDKPVYLLNTRSGYVCSWCALGDGRLISIPHPLSPCSIKMFDYPQDVDILGRVVGVSVRLIPNNPEKQTAHLSSQDTGSQHTR